MTLTLNDTLAFYPYTSPLDCSVTKFSKKANRNQYQSITYTTSPKESQGKSLHSAQKCCIFAPAIERTAFCALLGSSLKTSTGHK